MGSRAGSLFARTLHRRWKVATAHRVPRYCMPGALHPGRSLLPQPPATSPHPRPHSHGPLCRVCNRKIIAKVQQLICFAFHDSRLLLETASEAKEAKKIVTLFYLD